MEAPTVLYLAGLAFSEALRLPRRLRRLRSPRAWSTPGADYRLSEILVLSAVIIGIWVLPIIYAFTDWLDAFDYRLPGWAMWPGVCVFLMSLVLRWKAQLDLGAQWSSTLETARGHRLVSGGIYKWMRHPIYASLILWAAAQPLLLLNLMAGWGGTVAVALIWLIRVPKEERLMLDVFGEEYSQYMERTGRLIPRCTPPHPDPSSDR